jgi:uncharacterized membrane protein (DUF485 family)
VENKVGAARFGQFGDACLPAKLPAASCRRMSSSTPPPSDPVHSETFLGLLMRRQLQLSVACAAAFLVVLLGLPLANYFAPEFMASRVAGFTLSWLVLGVLFFPAVWVISYIFIRRSIRLEEEEVRSVERLKAGGGSR